MKASEAMRAANCAKAGLENMGNIGFLLAAGEESGGATAGSRMRAPCVQTGHMAVEGWRAENARSSGLNDPRSAWGPFGRRLRR